MDRWASGIDTAWLQLDRETNRMVVHGLLFCAGPVDLEALRERVAQRWVAVYPGLRQRPTWPAGPAGPARWVDAPPDLERHVTTMALPEPGDDAALEGRIGELMSRPLPTDRPWWRMELVTGYRGDDGGSGSAVHVAIHHGLADGVALNHLFHALADHAHEGGAADPCTPAAYAAPPRHPARGHDLRLLHREIRERASSLWDTVRRVSTPEGAYELVATGRAVRSSAALLARPPREVPSALQGRPGVAKAARWTSAVPLDDVRAAGKEQGGSVNDVVCAAIAGALRTFLGEGAPRLRAVMPSNLRPLDEPISDELGNEFGLVLPPLPTDEADPARRVERMHRAMATIKRTDQALATFAGIAGAGLASASFTQGLVRRYARAASLIISNVPGPLEELTIDGARVRDVMFWVPCSGDLGLGVSVLSYAGRIRLGVDADLGLLGGEAGVDRFTEALEEELARLRTR
ncbi:WS/DGAT domain-containing protein [Actinomycetospora sp.]|jgi:WS/DGAT/MGAT family acyltransferase|uniref:WS/DGAT domain-containing protein n=1 Tax=Actinomycetospora sp. TaxID=1872135 RepID=UPI002F40B2D1